jgi:hypothetical protein
MFAINREQNGTAASHFGHEYGPCHDQRLLVGQKHFFAGLYGGKRWAESGGADYRGHDDIGFGQAGNGFQRCDASVHLRSDPGRLQTPLQGSSRIRFRNNCEARLELQALLEQFVDLVVG